MAGEVATLPPVAHGWRVFPGAMHYYSKGVPLCGARPIGPGVPFEPDDTPRGVKKGNGQKPCRECKEKHALIWSGRFKPSWESSVPHVTPDQPAAT